MNSRCVTTPANRIRRVFGAMAAAAIALLAFVGPVAAASAATGPARTAAGSCPYGYFCIYQYPNYTGTMYALYYCHDYPVQWPEEVGSWINNQTPGTRAVITDHDGSRFVTQPAYSYISYFDWSSVADIKPC